MWNQLRAIIAGVVGGLLVLIYGLVTVGTKDPTALAVRSLIAVVVVWIVSEILQTRRVRSRLPFVWVGFGSKGRRFAKESDAGLVTRIDALVKNIGLSMATYLRYRPTHKVGSIMAEWEQNRDEEERYDRETCARLIEQHGQEVYATLAALGQRGTIDFVQQHRLVGVMEMVQMGLPHHIQRIAAELTAAERRL